MLLRVMRSATTWRCASRVWRDSMSRRRWSRWYIGAAVARSHRNTCGRRSCIRWRWFARLS